MSTWEVIAKGADNRPTIERFEVPGGWLYRTTTWEDLPLEGPLCEQVTFVPRPTMVEVITSDHRGFANE